MSCKTLCVDNQAAEKCEDLQNKNDSKDSLYYQLLKGQNCDATFEIGHKTKIKVHKAVLSRSSPHLSIAFRKRDLVKISDIPQDVMRCIIKYAYTGTVYFVNNRVFDLMEAARSFRMTNLENKCEEMICQRLAVVNCLEAFSYARARSYDMIYTAAHNYILKQFLRIGDLCDLELEILREFLKDDKLNVCNEAHLWEVILSWIDHDQSRRSKDIITLLSCVRLKLINKAFIHSVIEVHPYVIRKRKAWRLLLAKNSSDTLRECQRLSLTESTFENAACDLLCVINNNPDGTGLMFIYNELNDAWRRMFIGWEPSPRFNYGCIYNDGKIYILGGRFYYDCWNYNPKIESWTKLPDISCPRSQAGVILLKGVIYYIGGSCRIDVTKIGGSCRPDVPIILSANTVEIYSIQLNKWKLTVPMNVPRISPATASYNGKIYVVGGYNSGIIEKSAECYDPKMDRWTMLPPMNTARDSPSCVAYRGCIYVMGGYNERGYLCSVEKFNVAEEVWYPVADMNNPRKDFSAVVLNDKIYVVGGLNLSDFVHEIERYDEHCDRWLVYQRFYEIDQTTEVCIITTP